METGNNKKIVWILGVVFVLAIISAFFYYDRENAYAELERLKFVPTPEGYTELYFKDPSSLPEQAVSGETIDFSFVIHNVEDATTTYPYEVYFQDQAGKRTVVAQGSVIIADGSSNAINLGYTFPTVTTTTVVTKNRKNSKQDIVPVSVPVTGEMIVELTSLDQQIDFLLPQANP